jgi:hypothetical protein
MHVVDEQDPVSDGGLHGICDRGRVAHYVHTQGAPEREVRHPGQCREATALEDRAPARVRDRPEQGRLADPGLAADDDGTIRAQRSTQLCEIIRAAEQQHAAMIACRQPNGPPQSETGRAKFSAKISRE